MEILPWTLVCASILFFGSVIYKCSNDCNDINTNSFIDDENEDDFENHNKENEIYSKIPLSQVIER